VRVIKFREAIREAHRQTMHHDDSVYLLGVGITDPKAVWQTVEGLYDEFGPDRFVEGPLAEQMLTGVAFSSALLGLRPVLIHHRIDFLPLTMDQIVNHCAKWRYMFGNQQSVPLVIRAVVGRGWGNGPQHTQSLHGTFAHIPGIKVVVPSNAADAKGLLVSATFDDDPVIFIEHRWMHEDEGEVAEEMYRTPLGKAKVVREGDDVTLVTSGPLVQEAHKAAKTMATEGVSVEVIDLRTIRPLDYETILNSLQKTGRLVVADPDWGQGGVASAIVEHIACNALELLHAAPRTVHWPNHPVPASYGIEPMYYPMAQAIAQSISGLVEAPSTVGAPIRDTAKALAGPF
jgi:pyruvate dehydrogenase E1 component beta subunit